MTQRSFYEYVASHAEDADVKAMAQAWLDKQDAKKAEKASADADYLNAIAETLAHVDNPVTASELGTEIGVSTAKAASLLKKMRENGTVVAIEEIKGGKVVRTYKIA